MLENLMDESSGLDRDAPFKFYKRMSPLDSLEGFILRGSPLLPLRQSQSLRRDIIFQKHIRYFPIGQIIHRLVF